MIFLFAGCMPVAAKILASLASQSPVKIVGVMTGNRHMVSSTAEVGRACGIRIVEPVYDVLTFSVNRTINK